MKKLSLFVFTILIGFSFNSIAQQDGNYQLGQLGAGAQYNGFPIGSNIRLLKSTIDVSTVLADYQKGLSDITIRDFNVAGAKFLVADNVRERAETEGAAADFGVALGHLFNRTLYNSASLQNLKGIYPFSVEITSMFKIGDKSYITLDFGYANNAADVIRGRKTVSQQLSDSNFALDNNFQTHDQTLIPTDVGAIVSNRLPQIATLCDNYSCQFLKTPLSDIDRVQEFQFACGVSKGKVSLRMELNRLLAKRMEHGYKFTQTSYEAGTIHSQMVIDSRRSQQEASVDLDIKLADLGAGDLCLNLGFSNIQTESLYVSAGEALVYRGPEETNGGEPWKAPTIQAFYAGIQNDLATVQEHNNFNMYRLGFVMKLNQRNHRVDARLARIALKEKEARDEEARNRLEAQEQLNRTLKKSMLILDEAEKQIASSESVYDVNAILHNAEGRAAAILNDLYNEENELSEFIDEAAHSAAIQKVYDRVVEIQKKPIKKE